jgi:hypothetical protein
MKLDTFTNSEDLFQTCVVDNQGNKIYSTDGFSSEIESINIVKDWLFWFENAPINKANSIYYILSIPDNWMGGIICDNPYSGLQVKIGITKDLRKRISNLQTGSEGQLVIHAIEPGSRKKELEIHKKFESDRRQGEWFACSLNLYKHIIETWRKNILLPPEYQEAVLVLWERIRIYRGLRKDGRTFDMINPSINCEVS